MALFYKFKSGKEFFSIAMDAHFISLANLKQAIFHKHLAKGKDYDLIVSNVQTNLPYDDEATLIPKNTSVLIHRVPGPPSMTIVIGGLSEEKKQAVSENHEQEGSILEDEFGEDVYSVAPKMQLQSVLQSNSVQDTHVHPNRVEEESKIKALVHSSALDWQQPTQRASNGFGGVRFGQMVQQSFGQGIMEKNRPPPGYICRRCRVPGHLIQHCPTNGDPNYDIKRVRPPTGIPMSMLMPTQNGDGSYALPNGTVACLKPNEAAFDKEIQGISSLSSTSTTSRSISDIISPELLCPLCKQVMKDAVITSKCCLRSYCDKCIRDHTISKFMCACGATDVLADHLVPNITLRKTIIHFIEESTTYSSGQNTTRSISRTKDMVPARLAESKAPSPTISATTSTDESKLTPTNADKANNISDAPHQPVELVEKSKSPSSGNVSFVDENVQQKNESASQPAGKTKKPTNVPLPTTGAMQMQWGGPQDHMMPFASSACNQYWGGMQFGMNSFVNPYAGVMPYMGYVPGPFTVPPHNPFGQQRHTMPVPPAKDLSGIPKSSNSTHPVKKDETKAQKTESRRKSDIDQHDTKDQGSCKDVSESTKDIYFVKVKQKVNTRPTCLDRHEHNQNKRATSLGQSHHYYQYERQTSPDRSRSHHHNHSHHQYERENNVEHSPPHEVEDRVRLGKRRDRDPPLYDADHGQINKRRLDHDERIKAAKKSDAAKKQNVKNHSSSEYSFDVWLRGEKDHHQSTFSSSHHHRKPSSKQHHQEVKPASETRKSNNIILDDPDLSDDEDRNFKRRSSWCDSGSPRKSKPGNTKTDTMSLPSLNPSRSQVSCF